VFTVPIALHPARGTDDSEQDLTRPPTRWTRSVHLISATSPLPARPVIAGTTRAF